MIRVLFVCLGNICRSPMAEGLFKKMVQEKGLDQDFVIESRATSTWEEGNPPHPKTMAILDREKAILLHKKSTQITKNDFLDFDYIIGMDHENIRYLKKHAGIHQNKVYLLRDITPDQKGEEVPDPYYTGHYELTYQLLNESLQKWLDFFLKELKN